MYLAAGGRQDPPVALQGPACLRGSPPGRILSRPMTKQRILVVDDDPSICRTLAKPFTLDEMLAVVKQALEQQSR
jgi:hypothetical protein